MGGARHLVLQVDRRQLQRTSTGMIPRIRVAGVRIFSGYETRAQDMEIVEGGQQGQEISAALQECTAAATAPAAAGGRCCYRPATLRIEFVQVPRLDATQITILVEALSYP